MSKPIPRRTLFLGAFTAASAVLVLPGAATKLRDPEQIPDAEGVRKILTAHFGRDIAVSRSALDFSSDALAFLQHGLRVYRPAQLSWSYEFDIVTLFLQSTTYLAHVERGVPFEHLGISHHERQLCQSQLVVRS